MDAHKDTSSIAIQTSAEKRLKQDTLRQELLPYVKSVQYGINTSLLEGAKKLRHLEGLITTVEETGKSLEAQIRQKTDNTLKSLRKMVEKEKRKISPAMRRLDGTLKSLVKSEKALKASERPFGNGDVTKAKKRIKIAEDTLSQTERQIFNTHVDFRSNADVLKITSALKGIHTFGDITVSTVTQHTVRTDPKSSSSIRSSKSLPDVRPRVVIPRSHSADQNANTDSDGSSNGSSMGLSDSTQSIPESIRQLGNRQPRDSGTSGNQGDGVSTGSGYAVITFGDVATPFSERNSNSDDSIVDGEPSALASQMQHDGKFLHRSASASAAEGLQQERDMLVRSRSSTSDRLLGEPIEPPQSETQFKTCRNRALRLNVENCEQGAIAPHDQTSSSTVTEDSLSTGCQSKDQTDLKRVYDGVNTDKSQMSEEETALPSRRDPTQPTNAKRPTDLQPEDTLLSLQSPEQDAPLSRQSPLGASFNQGDGFKALQETEIETPDMALKDHQFQNEPMPLGKEFLRKHYTIQDQDAPSCSKSSKSDRVPSKTDTTVQIDASEVEDEQTPPSSMQEGETTPITPQNSEKCTVSVETQTSDELKSPTFPRSILKRHSPTSPEVIPEFPERHVSNLSKSVSFTEIDMVQPTVPSFQQMSANIGFMYPTEADGFHFDSRRTRYAADNELNSSSDSSSSNTEDDDDDYEDDRVILTISQSQDRKDYITSYSADEKRQTEGLSEKGREQIPRAMDESNNQLLSTERNRNAAHVYDTSVEAEAVLLKSRKESKIKENSPGQAHNELETETELRATQNLLLSKLRTYKESLRKTEECTTEVDTLASQPSPLTDNWDNQGEDVPNTHVSSKANKSDKSPIKTSQIEHKIDTKQSRVSDKSSTPTGNTRSSRNATKPPLPSGKESQISARSWKHQTSDPGPLLSSIATDRGLSRTTQNLEHLLDKLRTTRRSKDATPKLECTKSLFRDRFAAQPSVQDRAAAINENLKKSQGRTGSLDRLASVGTKQTSSLTDRRISRRDYMPEASPQRLSKASQELQKDRVGSRSAVSSTDNKPYADRTREAERVPLYSLQHRSRSISPSAGRRGTDDEEEKGLPPTTGTDLHQLCDQNSSRNIRREFCNIQRRSLSATPLRRQQSITQPLFKYSTSFTVPAGSAKCCASGIAVLESGRIIVVDQNSKSIHLFSANYSHLHTIVTPEIPSKVCPVEKYTAAVSFPYVSTICTYYTFHQVKMEKDMEIGCEEWVVDIRCRRKHMYALCRGGHIHVLDEKGTELKRLECGLTGQLEVNYTADRLFVNEGGRITCFSSRGAISWRESRPQCSVLVFYRDALYISDRDKKKLLSVFHNELSTRELVGEDISNPYAVCVSSGGDKLLVTQYEDSMDEADTKTVKVFVPNEK